ncbi:MULTISPECIES: hypothetical protein [Sulfurimonas]|uniref:Uncharacterized protein n=1 Tax=Sulfurimonas diazotrophicus TaxID=3131939 RepID=A0ABZ3HEH2_9BACT
MTFEQQWIEYDFNPYILFSAGGKVLSVNAEGQYLLGAVDRLTLFELATTYASPSFGFKTTFMELEYGRFKIFGIMVGYVNEEEIGIRFFQTPSFQFSRPEIEGELVNIYSLIDLCIATNSIGSKSAFQKDLDPTMPETRLNTDQFIRLLNKMYESFGGSETITTKLAFRIGEYILYEEKKYTFFSLKVSGNVFDEVYKSAIEQMCKKNHLFCEVGKKAVTVNIPIINQ